MPTLLAKPFPEKLTRQDDDAERPCEDWISLHGCTCTKMPNAVYVWYHTLWIAQHQQALVRFSALVCKMKPFI